MQAQQRKFSAYEWSALGGYVALLAYAAPHHVPWGDEAQAWLLARDSSLGDIFLRREHYEGTPALWHALLWLLIRLHMPFAGLHWVAGIAAVAGVAVWLRYAPLPRYLKLLFPFTFFMAFQYAIIARSYVLYPLLTFTACALIGAGGEETERRPQPVLLAVVLSLLANLCIFGTAMAAALGLFAIVRMVRNGSWKKMRGRCVAAVLLLFAAGILAAATAWPARDVDFTTGFMDMPQVKKLMHRETPEVVQPSATAPASSQAADAPQAPHAFLKQTILFAELTLAFPIAEQTWFALVVLLLVLYRCVSRGRWMALVPYLFVYAAANAVYAAEHHAGLLLIALIVTAWLSWPAALPANDFSRGMEIALRAALLAVFVIQTGWTVHAVNSERHVVYSPDREAADFLHAHAADKEGNIDKKIAGYYTMSDGPGAYFPQKIYFNQPSSFWRYSHDPRVALMSNADVLAAHPDYVVLGTTAWQQQLILNQFQTVFDPTAEQPGDTGGVGAFFEKNGYRETHRFCGLAPMRSGYYLHLCQIVLEPKT